MHSERRAEVTRARVLDAEQIKRRLDLSVLSLAAVERKEGDVRRVADVNDILADKPVRFVAAVLFDLVYFRNSLADLDLVGEAVILLEQLVDIEDILLISRKNVEQYDLMSLFSQRGSDKKSR